MPDTRVVAAVLPAEESPPPAERLYGGGRQYTVDPRILEPHPRNLDFFDDITGEKWDDFKDSIRKNGVLTPLLVTDKQVIISGHQRWRAAIELQLLSVPVIEGRFRTEDDALLALIETNIRQRGTLNQSQFKQARIIKELERLYKIKQGKGGDTTKKQCPNGHCSDMEEDSPSTRKELAQKLGVSETQYSRLKTLTNIIPGLDVMLDENVVPRNVAYVIARNLTELEQRDLMDSLLRLPVFKNRNRKFIDEGVQQGLKDKAVERDTVLREIQSRLDAAEAARKNAESSEARMRLEKEAARRDLDKARQQLADRPQEMQDMENMNRSLLDNLTQSRSDAGALRLQNQKLQRQLEAGDDLRRAPLAFQAGVEQAISALDAFDSVNVPDDGLRASLLEQMQAAFQPLSGRMAALTR